MKPRLVQLMTGLLIAAVAFWGRRAWALLGLSAGLASIAQLARGAHFLSHVLWAAWICAALGWVLLRVMDGVARRGRASSAAGLEPS